MDKNNCTEVTENIVIVCPNPCRGHSLVILSHVVDGDLFLFSFF